MSHCAEVFCRGIFYCFIIFGYRKSLEKRGGEYQDFPSKFFCLTVPKSFLEVSFTVAVISGTKKVWIRRGSSRFSVENFLSRSAEKFGREILYCCVNFGFRKSLDKRGGGEYQDFFSEIFCLTVPKISVGVHFTVASISGIEKVWIGGGGSIKIFCRK